MLEALTRYWWLVALRGAAALLFGFTALLWPDLTLLVLVAFFGAYALVNGVLTLGTAIFGDEPSAGDRAPLTAAALIGVVAGFGTLAWPGITVLVLLWLIAGWALATGGLEIVAAIRLRAELDNEWLLGLAGGLTVLVGVALVVWPESGALAAVYLLGGFAITFGVVLLGLARRLRVLHREAHPATTHPLSH
ncbi:MAG: HdeD family acid-resistance protein [Micromonosporaceae bacterium]